MSDLISRQAAIDEAEEWIETYNSERGGQRERDAIKHVISGIKKLPPAHPEPQWIPCSERLPDKTDDYLCSYNGCAVVDICEYDPDRNEWGFYYDYGWKVVSNVTAWMPLPEPYTERREDG